MACCTVAATTPRAQRRLLNRAIKEVGNDIHSFADAFPYLDGVKNTVSRIKMTAQEKDNGAELLAAIESMACLEAVNVTSAGNYPPEVLENQIDMIDLFREPQVAYFYLESGLQQSGTRELGRLALFSLLGAAIHHEHQGAQRPVQIYVFIDEFQALISENLAMLLEMARSKGISITLCHQAISQLKQGEIDLTETIDEVHLTERDLYRGLSLASRTADGRRRRDDRLPRVVFRNEWSPGRQ